jgi:hypothetical protein
LEGDVLKILRFIFALLILMPFQKASSQKADNPGPITLKVRALADRHQYKLTDTVVICGLIENISPLSSVLLFSDLGWGHSGGLTIRIVDPRGKDISDSVLQDYISPPPKALDSGSFVTLRPGTAFGACREDPVKALFPKTGSYTLSVQYWSPLDESFVKAKGYWGIHKGRLVSETVSINVLP